MSPMLSFMAGTFAGVFQGVFKSIGNIIGDLKNIFGGLIDFITGVLTGNWSRAWKGFVNVFKGIFGGIADIVKSPLNAVIGLINGAIGSLNKISISIPSWIPGMGGKNFGVNLPHIPYLAKGGVIDQPTLAMVGEAGKEAVMPLENNTGWIDVLAGKLNSKGQSSDEVVKLLQIIIDILKSLNMDIDVDGDNLAKVVIKQLNKRTRTTGKTELII